MLTTRQTPEILSYLNWETIHDYILPYLDIYTLHQLSFTCQTFLDLVESHLSRTKHIIIPELLRKSLKEKHLLCLAQKTGNLRHLDLSGMWDAVSNNVLKMLINSNHELRVLNISRCFKINDKGFEIDDAYCKEITDSHPLSKLEILVANWCRMFPPQCLVRLAHAPLRVISLAGTWSTNDEAISDCVTFFKDHLECLNINKCYKVTDASVNLLVHCKKLRILKISSCWRVNDSSIYRLVDNCKDLEQVAMDDCRSITKGIMFMLNERGVLLLEAAGPGAAEKWDLSESYLRKRFRF